MKRRQRKPILDVNGEQSDSPRRRWHNKYEQIVVDHPEQNGSPNNPLTNLLGQYDSDSESEERHTSSNVLNDKVNDFLKEIQAINPEKVSNASTQHANVNVMSKGIPGFLPQPKQTMTSALTWQECFDETTGYPYYWHMETNEVTWDLPNELRALRNIPPQESMSHNNYLSHWSNAPAKTYPQPQNNIPEGMIPKEVVARNRNRQVENKRNQLQAPERPMTLKEPCSKDEDSDDGKIEMITSFGNDESDSDESLSNEVINKFSPEKLHSYKLQNKSQLVSANSKAEPVKMGPALPKGLIPMFHGPENANKVSNDRSNLESNNDTKEVNISSDAKEEEILKRLKSQAKLLQSMSSRASESVESRKSTSLKKTEKKKESGSLNSQIKVSLVPGYEDDSDIEEETMQRLEEEPKPLFPISDYHENETVSSVQNSNVSAALNERLGKKVETKQTDSGCIRIFEYSDVVKEKEGDEKTSEGQESEAGNFGKNENEETKGEQDTVKANKFLEDLETPAKAFQRKKRIAFDVIPNKSKPTESQDSFTNKQESSNMAYSSSTYENTEKYGLGFQKEDKDINDLNVAFTKSVKETLTATTGKKSISFVKGETMNLQSEESTKSAAQIEAEKAHFKALINTTIEKLKFLSEGSQPASAVQIMAIQLQTLFGAWESGDLKEKYFNSWLTSTSCELGRLEQTAAPPGWDCQWDRSHKRYYYRNAMSGEAQWTYPETDVVGGTEEMELCTTPPPEQEEAPVIEVNVPTTENTALSNRDDSQSTPSCEKQEKQTENDIKEMTVPPPPQISSPSPPPPPRICAEDLKRGKKRKGNDIEEVVNGKKDKSDKDPTTVHSTTSMKSNSQGTLAIQSPKAPNPSSNEPLPPGVDSPDMAYSLSTSAIESTVLYTAASQQTNPIYAATLGNTAVPLLAHHPALMQSQLMHYSTYHPLHNQMIMATANRLAEQDAIQFMVADYTRLYENSQVIAKPPVKTQRESIGSAIDSFYNDIACMEQNKVENEIESPDLRSMEIVPSSAVQVQQTEAEKSPVSADASSREKKKKKIKMGISKKQKEVSSMVAKWQRAQKNFVD